jgi:hypothetical protein
MQPPENRVGRKPSLQNAKTLRAAPPCLFDSPDIRLQQHAPRPRANPQPPRRSFCTETLFSRYGRSVIKSFLTSRHAFPRIALARTTRDHVIGLLSATNFLYSFVRSEQIPITGRSARSAIKHSTRALSSFSSVRLSSKTCLLAGVFIFLFVDLRTSGVSASYALVFG